MERSRAALHLVRPVDPRDEGSDAPLGAEQAFRRYSAYVASIAHRLVGRDEEVDDVVQEVFLVAVRGLGALREADAIRGWLASVTVRVARKRLRLRRLRGFLRLDESPDYQHVADAGASPEHRALLARVYRALDELPVDQRIAWSLRHVEGQRLEDVATLAGCSLATAKRRIGAAEIALERKLGDV